MIASILCPVKGDGMRKSTHSTEYERFLKLLRQRRVSVGVTQAQLGEMLGLSQSDISKCERGERRLDIIEVWRWCRSLQVPLATFAQDLESAIGRGRKR